jgi:hypothetical protein
MIASIFFIGACFVPIREDDAPEGRERAHSICSVKLPRKIRKGHGERLGSRVGAGSSDGFLVAAASANPRRLRQTSYKILK